jgi:hypothetical protein
VLIDTLTRADRLGADVRIMRGGYDIDTVENLRRVERDLVQAPPERARHLREWLADANKRRGSRPAAARGPTRRFAGQFPNGCIASRVRRVRGPAS